MKSNRRNSKKSWLSEKWADFRHYWHPKVRARRAEQRKRRWKTFRKTVQASFESKPAERRMAAKDRERRTKARRESMLRSAQGAASTVVNSPKTIQRKTGDFFKEGGKTIKRWRKISAKEVLKECWTLYLQALRWVLDRPGAIFGWWKKRGWILKIASLTVIISIIAAPFVFFEAKTWRAKALLEESKELEANDQISLAYLKSRTAALLDPEAEAILDRTVALGEQINSAETIWWSERLAQRRDFDRDSIEKVIDFSIDFNQQQTAAKYLSMLAAREPDSPLIDQARLQILLKRNQTEKAAALALEMIEKGEATPLAYTIYVRTALLGGTAEHQARAQEYLSTIAKQPDETGLELSRLVLSLPASVRERTGIEPTIALNRIIENPAADRDQRVNSSGVAFFIDAISADKFFESVRLEYDLDSELPEALETLSSFGHYDNREELLTVEMAEGDPLLARAYLEHLVFGEQADLDAAEAILSESSESPLPLTIAEARFWRAMIANERGEPEEFVATLTQSLESSSRDQWDYMHRMLLRHAESPQQLVFYRELYGRHEKPILAAQRYIFTAYALSLEDELQQLIARVNPKRLARNPDALTLLLYLRTLYDQDLSETRALLEEMVVDYPKSASAFRVLAFAYAKSGNALMARKILQEIPKPAMDANPTDRLIHSWITMNRQLAPKPEELLLERERLLTPAARSSISQLKVEN